ncbi:sensor histidine kinase [Poseidonibacter lekithochrous]|uniref:sensor histidine kinase n=1 Tax=Poseidonibacter lekithochrous TaxID=1904463 RepID=UPI000D33AF0F|nr:cache domain-containing protein [Poseidonibacter lekithochrous]
MQGNKNFTFWIIFLPILSIILTSSILTYKFISYEKHEAQEEAIKLEKRFTQNIKKRIQNRINRVINLIETKIQITKDEEKKNVKNIIHIGYKTIEETYLSNKHLPYDEIIKIIRQRLKNLKFYSNESGYFFILNLNDLVLMHPQKSEQNKVVTNLQDKKGKYFIQSFRNIANSKTGEGFDTWYWKKPNTSKIAEKIGYIKVFKPLNLYIGTAKYKEDIDNKIKMDALKLINIIKYDKDEYVFVINKKGTTLAHINKNFINTPISKLTEIEQTIINNILKKAEKKEGNFIEYIPTSHNINKNLSKKISFVKIIPSLDWIVGTGQYTTTLQLELEKRKKELTQELTHTTNDILIISIVITMVLIIILTSISRNLQSKLRDYEYQLANKNQSLKELNESLEEKVKKQLIKTREKEELLHQQSKLAAMGEMIGNIAHQWRQPLSTISTAASGMKMQNEMNLLTEKEMNRSLDAIVFNTKALSQTIEDFRGFFKKDKEKSLFRIDKTIEKVILLLSASLTNKEITIVKNLSDDEIFNLGNELMQALLNIINNAKDALLVNEIENKYIFITTSLKDDKLHIEIKDNAGGIPLEIMHKVFEPYFTTKFKSQGTGIGLYMSRTIIVNHMKGKIEVSNSTFTYKGEKYEGACFDIILDKKS